MSAPAFAWALERGASLKLMPADRLVLIYLADMANGERVCWPGQPTIERFTGLAPRTVRASIHRLVDQQLIRVETSPGRVTKYHILRPTPANGAGAPDDHPGKTYRGHPGKTHHGMADQLSPAPANGAGAPRQNVPDNPSTICTEPRHHLPPTPANGAPDPSKTQERDPRRAHARARQQQILDSGEGSVAAPPEPPGDATSSRGDDPFPGVDDAKAFMSRTLGRPVHLDAMQPETITEDDRPQTEADRERMATEIAKLVESIAGSGQRGVKARKGALTMRAYPPGERRVFDAEQQQDIYRALTRPKAAPLAGEQLAAARRIAMARISVLP